METAGIIAAVLSALFMGTIGVVSKFTGLSPELITFCRLFFGAGFMWLFLLCIGRLHFLRQWPSWPVLINGGMLAGFIIFYVQAMNFTTMANAIMLVYLAPVAAALFAHFFLGERLSWSGFILICSALFGFSMMMEFTIDLHGGSNQLFGIGCGLISMLAYAVFILINKMVRTEIHVYTRIFYQLLAGAAVMLPFLALDIPSISPVNGLWMLGTGLFPGFLAVFCAVVALSRLPTATFGTLTYVEPVAVVVFGWVLFNESLSTLQMGGCIVIIFSGILQTYLVSRPQPMRAQ